MPSESRRTGSSERAVLRDTPSTSGPRFEPADFVRMGRRLVKMFTRAARQDVGPTLSELLLSHLGPEAAALPGVSTSWPAYEHVNVQLGLENWLAEPGKFCTLVGLTQYQHREFSLGDLAQPGQQFGPSVGNTARVQLATGPNGEVHDCIRCGIYLVEVDDDRLAILLREAEPHGPGGPTVRLEALARTTDVADRALLEISALALKHNVFRGQVLSFESEMFGPHIGPAGPTLQFLPRPELPRSHLVLPAGKIELIERQVVGIARNRELLRSSGQHLKRGLLLHGLPGTGKTHSIRYLLGRLEGVTVIILSGRALGAIAAACSIARTLQPAAVIVEDVDLIAEQRTMFPGQNPLLFELLNQMDGVGEDVDVVFLLTTNRPDLLEPALAARPGRVDQAIEIPLPDEDARSALIQLYKGEMRLDCDVASIVDRTGGVTASFLKELLRRSAMEAIEHGHSADGTVVISDNDVLAAFDELRASGNELTRVLLGDVSARSEERARGEGSSGLAVPARSPGDRHRFGPVGD